LNLQEIKDYFRTLSGKEINGKNNEFGSSQIRVSKPIQLRGAVDPTIYVIYFDYFHIPCKKLKEKNSQYFYDSLVYSSNTVFSLNELEGLSKEEIDLVLEEKTKPERIREAFVDEINKSLDDVFNRRQYVDY
jgi:hypothetical protein